MILEELKSRSGVCELCSSQDELSAYSLKATDTNLKSSVLVCSTCKAQIEKEIDLDEKHWNCLHDSMWSQEPAVQAMAYVLLSRLGWQEQVDMLYLEDETLTLAKDILEEDSKAPTLDANGVKLQAGDTVNIIKDLEVKGAGFTAKRGTAVRNISLGDNPEQIEGRVNGVKIVLLTKYLKKA